MSTETPPCPDKHPLQRDGTSQAQRFPDALMPDAVQLHQFSTADWMKFAYEFASYVGYYDVQDDTRTKGNWQKFFIPEHEVSDFLANADGQQTEPHLALFIAFLRLMAHTQEALNGLTKRHLDFYYHEVLQLKHKPFTPDRAFVIFELAKHAVSERVPAGTVLHGGKDDVKKTLHYVTEEEVVVNTAEVAAIKSILHIPSEQLHYADMANSKDGIGTELVGDTWYAFGHDVANAQHVPLPAATVGFALASHILNLKEGTRRIQIKWVLDVRASFTTAPFVDVKDRLKVFLTAPDDWLAVPATEVTVEKTNSTTAEMTLELELDNSIEPIVPYRAEVHQEHYHTNLPVVRILFDTSVAYDAYAALLDARVRSAKIAVDVEGLKDVQAENDLGVLNPAKPFYPFGTQPKVGANFYIGSNEIFSKKFSDVKIAITWKDKPPNMKDHYIAYQKDYLDEYLTADNYQIKLTDEGLAGDDDPQVEGDDYFTVTISHIQDGKWHHDAGKKLFAGDDLTVGASAAASKSGASKWVYQTGASRNKYIVQKYLQQQPIIVPLFNFNPGFIARATSNAAFSHRAKDGFFKLTLDRDFLHKHYARLYAIAMSKTDKKTVIPNEPYTPMAESISLSYRAEAENAFVFPMHADTPEAKLDNYTARPIQLFHEMPFGQSEQHVFLKDQFGTRLSDKSIRLLPSFGNSGACYIGLRKATPGQLVSMLFSVAEGSENPLVASFTDDRRITWWYMVNNEWLPLPTTNLLKDSTNNFLKTGMITFRLPPDMTEQHAAMPSDCVWLCARLPEELSYSAVCRFIAVETQAASVVFKDNGNSLSHLETALPPGSIAKFIDKPAGVKKVTQPYAAFGGAPVESDEDYYVRVSERLRHKNRAITIWDYERLILKQFTGIYKVKCLNHTASTPHYFELAPGNVTLIPIPDVRNHNLYDILQPRVSSNTLREIEQYIADLSTAHIDVNAEHPAYEPVVFDLKVKFYKQYDAQTYKKMLNEELIKCLAPWCFDTGTPLLFGGMVYKSVIITQIEDLPYVDYVTDFKMKIDTPGNTYQSVLAASSAKSILTSVNEHTIVPLLTDPDCDH